ncbi:MAG: hypothetical protein ACLFSH_16385 [Phormidium sp.]
MFPEDGAPLAVRPYVISIASCLLPMKTNPKDILSIGLFVVLSLFVGYLSLNFILAIFDKWA